MLWVGRNVAVLPLSVVLVTVLVRAPPAELWVLAPPVMPQAREGVAGDALVGGGVRTVGVGPRLSWRRFPWALLAGVLALAPLGVVDAVGVVPGGVAVVAWLSLTLRVAVAEVSLSVVVSVMPVVRSLRALLWFTASLGGQWPVFGGRRCLVPVACLGGCAVGGVGCWCCRW